MHGDAEVRDARDAKSEDRAFIAEAWLFVSRQEVKKGDARGGPEAFIVRVSHPEDAQVDRKRRRYMTIRIPVDIAEMIADGEERPVLTQGHVRDWNVSLRRPGDVGHWASAVRGSEKESGTFVSRKGDRFVMHPSIPDVEIGLKLEDVRNVLDGNA